MLSLPSTGDNGRLRLMGKPARRGGVLTGLGLAGSLPFLL